MPKKISTFIFAFLSTVTFCFSQYNGDRGYPSVSSKKPVTEYFDSVDDKSYYQSQRIHGMKQEINRYSERLHGLQKRFDEIFTVYQEVDPSKNLLIQIICLDGSKE